MNLLSIGTNAKTIKSDSLDVFQTAIMYLSPHKQSGVNICSSASPACAAACLNTAGRGRFNNVQEARFRKTRFFIDDPVGFLDQLELELQKHSRNSYKKGFYPCVRLNGTSDIMWERYGIIDKYQDIMFYDYTKHYKRMMRFLNGQLPLNYHLTFSRSENNHDKCIDVLEKGGSVSMVFDKIPERYLGYKVVNGDLHDLRFADPVGSIIGLKAKGKAKKDTAGFTIITNKAKIVRV